MKTIFADYNAMTPSGEIRLNCRGSQEDLQEAGTAPGDWAWLSDGEVLVGGLLRADPYWGTIASPDWETEVLLDEYTDDDFLRVWKELEEVLQRTSFDAANEGRAFRLLTVVESISPPQVRAVTPPGYFARRRAGALHFLGKPELALIEIEEALRIAPEDSHVSFVQLEILRGVDPSRAWREAESRAEVQGTSATILAACINIWAAAADQVSDQGFEAVGVRILDWVDRFERAPGRDQVRASVLAQVQFNRGLVLLRLGQRDDARHALDLAHAADPVEPAIDEALRLEVFDDRAREIGARLREKPVRFAA